MQDPVTIKVDSETTLRKKRYWGTRLIVFSILGFILSVAIGFNQLITDPLQKNLLLPLAAEALNYLSFAGLVAGIILIASRKRVPGTAPYAPQQPITTIQDETQAQLAQGQQTTYVSPGATVRHTNATNTAIAVLCMTVPATLFILTVIVGITAGVGVGDGNVDSDTQTLLRAVGYVLILSASAFVPGIIIGIILLIRRRKIIHA